MAWPSTGAPPAGWLTLDGAEVPISDYQQLYNEITRAGTTFPFGVNTDGLGAAGSTHFRLPDLRGRAILTPSFATGRAMGATGGATTHTHSFTAEDGANTTRYVYLTTNDAHQHNLAHGNFNTTGGHGHAANAGTGTPNASANVMRQAGNAYNTSAAFDAHAHGAATWNTSASGDHDHTTNTITGKTVNEAGHFHLLEYTWTSAAPTPVSHMPPHTRVVYVVLAVPT